MKQVWVLVSLAALILVAAPAASSEETHVYPVTLTIAVDRPAHKLSGAIVTDAPSEFCESSTIRLRREMPGKDGIVARVFPVAGEWHLKSPKAAHGKRVYAEVLPYHLPSRPVECLGARSRTVTAP
jgi:hypothetical protein